MKEITLLEAADEINSLQRLLKDSDQSYAKQVAMTARLALEKDTLRKALAQYALPANWRFYHDVDNNLVWVCKLGPTLAYDILRTEADEQKGARNASQK